MKYCTIIKIGTELMGDTGIKPFKDAIKDTEIKEVCTIRDYDSREEKKVYIAGLERAMLYADCFDEKTKIKQLIKEIL